MYKQKYCLNKLISPFLYLTGMVVFCQGYALTTDQDQPIEIEADTAELDDQKGVTIYKGNVIVVQGSIRMTGETMTVYYTRNNDLDTVIMEGRPATYRQLPDNSEIYDEAEALRMEYYGLKNLIVLIDNAVVKQEDLRFSGSRIEYDTERSLIRARGQTKKENDDSSTDGGRVKITIKPKKKE
jgi:lipopolysaccharide export system protein LptA